MHKWTKYLLILNGILLIGLTIFHFGFWEIFNWKETLKCLNNDNRALMQAFALVSSFSILFMALVTLIFNIKLVTTLLGKIILFYFSFFFILRVAIELIFFNYDINIFIMLLCGSIGIIYILPFFIKREIINK